MSDKPMSRAEARRRAAFHAALVLETALGGGWDSLDQYGEEGRELVEREIGAIIDRLEARAQPPALKRVS
jgi:hypothetical protein